MKINDMVTINMYQPKMAVCKAFGGENKWKTIQEFIRVETCGKSHQGRNLVEKDTGECFLEELLAS